MSTAVKRKGAPLGSSPDAKKPKANGSITAFFGAPKPASTAAGGAKAAAPNPPAVKFDKAKWVATLSEEEKELLQLEIDTMHESWLGLLKDDIKTKEFLDLKKFLRQETKSGRKWFPPAEDVYSWSYHTPFHDVKVVILGQDPYHNVNQAHGLAFSVRSPTVAPPSLRNMYIALKKDYPSFEAPPNKGGLLTPWAERGVLMLNTCLTVRAHEAFSHANRGWERLTQKVLDLVAQKRTRGVVFMAWGTPAGKRVQKVDKQRHLVLQSVHPSPLSASRGFFDCGHFRKANTWLIERYGAEGEIDWALTPRTSTKELPAPEKEARDEEVAEEAKEKAEEAKEKVEAAKEQDKVEATKKQEEAEEDNFGSDDEEALEEVMRKTEGDK